MTTNKKKVLLCTGVSSEIDNENQYEKLLCENGFECNILEVLQFEFINLNEFQNRLLNSAAYNGKY